MNTAMKRVVSPSTGASITRSARFRPDGGRAMGLFSICTMIGTRRAIVRSSTVRPSIGQRASGFGVGDGVGIGVGDGVGVGDGDGDGVGEAKGDGMGVGSGAALTTAKVTAATMTSATSAPRPSRARRDRGRCIGGRS